MPQTNITTLNGVDLNNPTQTLSGSGYTTLPGGLIMQWGTGSVAAASGSSATVTLPKAYTSTQFVAIAGFNNSSIGGTSDILTYNLTTTQFSVVRGNNSGIDSFTNFFWISVGK